jgi:serine/threonine-protein kinase
MPELPPEPLEATVDLKLAEVMDRYSRQVEQGLDPDPEACLAEHPELAGDLAECLQGLAAMAELRNSVLPPEAAPPFEPRRLGDFELVRKIGGGGMGEVYEARQLRLGRTVALKLLLPGQLSAPSGRQRFRQEAEAAARLRHPGIVQIYDVELEGEPYFTMEYVAGPSLSERLAQGPLPIREAAEIVRQTALAIAHAHQQGVLHRDLKPSNVLLDEQGRPRVTDFGLAKRLDVDAGLTLSGQVMGTPSYMSPEQAAGKVSQIGPRSDVYGLGAILYELLTGRRPFLGATVSETLQQVQHQEPVPPEKLNFRIPFELSVICLKCLHKDPERRYASAQALAEDLRAFLEGRPIQARPETMLFRLYHAVRHEPYPEIMERRRLAHKAWLALLVCVGVTVLAGLDLAWPWAYVTLVVGGFALVVWQAPGRQDTLVERQVSSVWWAFLWGCLLTALLDRLMGTRPLHFSPVIAVLAGMANFMVGDLISGWFYVGGVACFLAAVAMVYTAPFDFLILGVVFFFTLLIPSWRYRARKPSHTA